MAIVSPAYGRDYKTARTAIEDWFNGKDFISKDILSMGKYCSTRDFKVNEMIEIRYNKLTKLAMVYNVRED